MPPYASPDVLPDSAHTIQSSDRREYDILLGEMHAMLDRIADCWRTDISTNALAVAGLTSEVARSGLADASDAASTRTLARLRTEIGHILTSQRAVSRRD